MPFRFITGNGHPYSDTIVAFRHRFLSEVQKLYVQVLKRAREMGLLKMGTIHLDEAKIHAEASRHSALPYEHAGKVEAQLKREVSELMVRAEAADQSDEAPDANSRGTGDYENRLPKLAEARAKIEARAQ